MIRSLTLAAVLAATPVLADTYDGSGTGTGQSVTEIIEVAPGHMVMNARTDYAKFDFGDGNPMSAMAGPCFGSFEVNMGVTTGGGKCVLSGGGDTAVLQWTAEAVDEKGGLHGAWSVRGGTGKWAEASGGGTFISVTDPATGMATNTIEGALRLP